MTSRKKRKILVTGCAGFIGSHVVDRFLAEGHRVFGVDDLSSGHEKFLKSAFNHGQRFDFIDKCFSSKKSLRLINTKSIDVVIHLAAIPRVSYSVENPALTFETNVVKTMNLIENCRHNIGRFIFASSSSVYGGAKKLPTPESEVKRPKSPYALQKSQIEDVLYLYESLYRLPSLSLRFFNVFGPRQTGNSPYSCAVSAWLTAIKQNKPLRVDGDGTQTRDLCYIDNVVDAVYRASLFTGYAPGDAINVACGSDISNNEIIDILLTRYGSLTTVSAPKRAGDVDHTLADVDKAKLWLDYKPLIHAREGIQLTADWYDENWDWMSKLPVKGV